jgi:hypothetical protein
MSLLDFPYQFVHLVMIFQEIGGDVIADEGVRMLGDLQAVGSVLSRNPCLVS